MDDLFLQILNMSLSAAWLVPVVLLLRLCLKKAPKWIHCLLWALVAVRLVIPFFPESPVSLLPSGQVFPDDMTASQLPAIHTGITAVNQAVNPVLIQTPARRLENWLIWGAGCWLAGTLGMLVYSVVSFLRLRRKTGICLRIGKQVYISDDVDTPFILGILRPRIYLPSGLSEEQQRHVLAHERAHLRRRDHWWKPLGYFLLAVHWFNPLIWLGYILLCRDIEKACDEKVIRDMDGAARKSYSLALLSCSLHRRTVLACPLAFGELAVKERIRGVLSYKKPVFWVVLAAVILCVAISGCFLTNPMPCVHTYEGSVTSAPTCTAEGMETLICSTCWNSKTCPVAMLPHTYGEAVVSQEPNCTQPGQLSATCTSCGQTHVVGQVPVNDVHDMENTQLRAPTCTDAGEGVNTCKRCGVQESCSYPLAEHDFKYGVTVNGTCTTPQRTQQICRKCGLYQWAVTGPTTGKHVYYLARGSEIRCSECGYFKGTFSWGLPGGNSSNKNNKEPSLEDEVISPGSPDTQLPTIIWDIANP